MLTINCATGNNDFIWFTSKEYPALFEYNVKTDIARVVAIFDKEHPKVNNLYGVLKKVEDKIYIAPICGDCFFIYDICKGFLAEKKIFDDDCTQGFKFRRVLHRGNKLFYVGCSLAAVAEIDLNTDNIRCTSFYEGNLHYVSDNNVFTVSDDDYIYWAGNGDGTLIQYNLNTREISFLNDLNIGTYTNTIKVDTDLFLVSNDNDSVKKINLSDKEMVDMTLPNEFNAKFRNFSLVSIFNNNIWFLPFHSNMLMKYDCLKKQFYCVKKFESDGEITYIFGGQYDAEHIWAYNIRTENLEIIHVCSNEIRQFQFNEIDGIEKLKRWYISGREMIEENSRLGIDLHLFLNCIVGEE